MPNSPEMITKIVPHFDGEDIPVFCIDHLMVFVT